MRMPNAYLNSKASFRSQHQILQEELRGHEKYYIVIWSKYVYYLRGHYSAIMTKSNFCFLYAHVQCMSELCCKFQIPASNTVVVETLTVLQSVTDMGINKGKTIRPPLFVAKT